MWDLSDSGTPGGDRARGDRVSGLQSLLPAGGKSAGQEQAEGSLGADEATLKTKHRSGRTMQLSAKARSRPRGPRRFGGQCWNVDPAQDVLSASTGC